MNDIWWGAAFAVLMLSACGLGPEYSVDQSRYRQTSSQETEIRISFWDQKAWLLDGEGRPVLETDISTGVPGHETPTGDFRVLEKLESKRSNRYGEYVRPGSEKVLAKSWEVETPPEGSEFRGISMPYWMRLTWDGVGMHVGEFPKRQRSSFGCIRVHEDAQPLIYGKTAVGTPVRIESGSLQEELSLR